MARKGERIHLSIPKAMFNDIKKRTTFCSSSFFQQKYTEEFLSERAIKTKLKTKMEEVQDLKKRLSIVTDSQIQTPTIDPERCPICTMFFHEDISIRKKTQVYKSLYVCAQCNLEQQLKIQQLVSEMKAAEESNGKEM